MPESLFLKRHSKRSYLDRPVEEEKLARIFESIQWCASCANKQPWRLIFVSDQNRREKFAGALAQGNEWAAKAPILVAVCGRKEDDYSRDDDPVEYYQFDCGMATLSLLLAAVDVGLMGHPMAGYGAPGVKEALEIPAEYSVLCVVSLGYEGPIEALDDRTRAKDESPRVRKEISEIIARDKFSFR